jgi:hypothetical protein
MNNSAQMNQTAKMNKYSKTTIATHSMQVDDLNNSTTITQY